jgi:lipopolysaccharide export system protein LptA
MKWLLYFCIFITSLYGQEIQEGNVSSLEASYDGNNLVLEGNVELYHELGKISSEKATLSRQEGAKDLPFSTIALEKHISIACKSKANLACASALLDFTNLKGTLFSGKAPEEYVVYSDQLLTDIPLQILSKIAHLLFEQQTPNSYAINKLTASESVTVYYGKDFVLKAEKAIYQKSPSQKTSLSGLIQAYGTPCTLLYQEKPITMQSIEIDTEKNLLYCKEPKGAIASHLFSLPSKQDLLFQSRELRWDQEKETLVLQKDVFIQEDSLGTISTSKELCIVRKNNAIESIHVEGESLFTHENSTLSSPGTLHVDGIKGEITACRSESQQLLYKDPTLSLQADSAIVKYAPDARAISFLSMDQNVQIRSLDSQGKEQYGLADRLYYDPNKKTAILSASAGKKVLFWDPEQGVTLSAKEVHLIQNPLTGKIEVQGVGNIKLSFSPEEFSLINRHFSKNQSKEDVIHE